MRVVRLLLALCCALIGAATVTEAALADNQAGSGQQSVEAPAADDTPTEPASGLGAKLKRALWIFLLLSIGALVLLIGTVLVLLWRAKQLVENAVKPNLPALERLVAKERAKSSRREASGTKPDLDSKHLAKKLIHRQATRAGLVGFVTGIGGLPALPIAIPIDLAATIKLQSNLVHMLRMANGGGVQAEDVSESSLWLITTGGYIWDLFVPGDDNGIAFAAGASSRWPFIHVEDLAELYLAILEKRASGIFHGTDDDNATVREVVGRIAEITGHPAKEVPAGDAVERFGRIGGFMLRDVWSAAPRSRELGWRPRYPSFRSAAPAAFQDYLAAKRLRAAASPARSSRRGRS